MTLVRVETSYSSKIHQPLEEHWVSTTETETGWAGPDAGTSTLVQFKLLDLLSTLRRSCTLPVSNSRPFRWPHRNINTPPHCFNMFDTVWYLFEWLCLIPPRPAWPRRTPPPSLNKQTIIHDWHQISNMRVLIYHVEAQGICPVFLNFPPPALEKCRDTLDV